MLPRVPETIEPEMEEWCVEVIAIGLRDMAPYQFQPVYSPFLEFDCGDHKRSSDVRSSKPSKKPNGRNPNFLEAYSVYTLHVCKAVCECAAASCVRVFVQRITLPVKLPKNRNPLFAPTLNVTVRDVRLGGLSKPVLGTVLSSVLLYLGAL